MSEATEFRVILTGSDPRARSLLRELAEVASVEPVESSSGSADTASAERQSSQPPTPSSDFADTASAGHERSSTTLVLGGARSGKSHWAEQQLTGPGPVDYVATSQPRPDDPEWVARVELHRRRRPAHWQTIETLDLVDVLASPSATPVLVDCLTLWLTHQFDRLDAWNQPEPEWRAALEQATGALVEAVAATGRHVILVSNEVGSGIVPSTASGRLFQDELGRLNTRVAARCDHVVLCTAGIAQRLK